MSSMATTDPDSIVAQIVTGTRTIMQAEEGNIPLHIPVFGKNAAGYVNECITTGWVSSVGKFVDRFEADLAEYTGAKRAVAVVNGTAALHIALKLCGVEPGDEVLLPSLTCLLYTSPSPRDQRGSRMPSSA